MPDVEIKWPWDMVWSEYIDGIVAEIKAVLPPDHELQSHDLFPGIKRERQAIFIVDDDTTGSRILMDFTKAKRWKKTEFKVPAMRVFRDDAEVAAMIERDHQVECAKHDADGTSKWSEPVVYVEELRHDR